MKISSNMKSFLIGFPVVIFVLVTLGFLISTFGPASLLILGVLAFLGMIGTIVGEAIRDKFRIWK